MSTGFDELLWAVTNYDPEHPDYEELSDIGDGQYLASAAADLIQELRERAEKAERDYQWMVERAADQHLSGYRELARRAADAETVADGLRAELARGRELCPEVIAFAHLMQHKLNMNAHKDGEGWGRDSGGKRGWKSCSPQFLMDKLYEEVLELTLAIHEGDSAKSIRQEAADVGNIAMMLADVCGALSQPAEQHDPLAVSDHCGERESLPLMARRPRHKDDDLGELYENGKRLCTISGEPPLREPMPGFVLYRIADTDEHGLPVVERTADMPEDVTYQAIDNAGRVICYGYSPPTETELALGWNWQRIEDFNEHTQRGQEGQGDA